VNLTIKDLDSKTMTLKIKQAASKKDRYIPLSNKFLELLREYYAIYTPKKYVFEGQGG